MQTTDKILRTQPADRVVRAAGALYLLLLVTSIFGFVTPQTLIVAKDATATAHNILASETLFRLAIVSGLIATIAFVFLARALYRLLPDVNVRRASLMVLRVFISILIAFLGALNRLAARRLLRG